MEETTQQLAAVSTDVAAPSGDLTAAVVAASDSSAPDVAAPPMPTANVVDSTADVAVAESNANESGGNVIQSGFVASAVVESATDVGSPPLSKQVTDVNGADNDPSAPTVGDAVTNSDASNAGDQSTNVVSVAPITADEDPSKTEDDNQDVPPSQPSVVENPSSAMPAQVASSSEDASGVADTPITQESRALDGDGTESVVESAMRPTSEDVSANVPTSQEVSTQQQPTQDSVPNVAAEEATPINNETMDSKDIADSAPAEGSSSVSAAAASETTGSTAVSSLGSTEVVAECPVSSPPSQSLNSLMADPSVSNDQTLTAAVSVTASSVEDPESKADSAPNNVVEDVEMTNQSEVQESDTLMNNSMNDSSITEAKQLEMSSTESRMAEQEKQEKMVFASELSEMRELVAYLMNMPASEGFLRPVDCSMPGLQHYRKVIKKPMDLGTVMKNLDDGKYPNAWECAKDVRLVWKNCLSFNADGSAICSLAVNLSNIFEHHYGRINQQLESEKRTKQLGMEKTRTVSEELLRRICDALQEIDDTGRGHCVEILEKRCPWVLNSLSCGRSLTDVEIDLFNIPHVVAEELFSFCDKIIQRQNEARNAQRKLAEEQDAMVDASSEVVSEQQPTDSATASSEPNTTENNADDTGADTAVDNSAVPSSDAPMNEASVEDSNAPSKEDSSVLPTEEDASLSEAGVVAAQTSDDNTPSKTDDEPKDTVMADAGQTTEVSVKEQDVSMDPSVEQTDATMSEQRESTDTDAAMDERAEELKELSRKEDRHQLTESVVNEAGSSVQSVNGDPPSESASNTFDSLDPSEADVPSVPVSEDSAPVSAAGMVDPPDTDGDVTMGDASNPAV